jgi:TPR repeat protein
MEFILILVLIGFGLYFFNKKKKGKSPNSPSDFKMGTDYAFGLGFPQMDALAAEAFTATAKTGDVNAYAALGNMYSRGVHFKQDYEEAYKWLKLAADAHHPTAMYQLAIFYIEGYGIPKDVNEAVRLLKESANLGEPSAQSALGMLYELGEYGLEKNARESLNLYMKSAKGNNAFSQYKVGDAYVEGNLLSKDVDKAFEYWSKAAENGNIQAMRRLRVFYLDGIDHIKPNMELASHWTKKAAMLDDCESQRDLGGDYLLGACGEVDYEQAAFWSRKAAEKGDAQAQYTLGIMLKRGFLGGADDLEEAKHWFELAASQGYESALEELKLMSES